MLTGHWPSPSGADEYALCCDRQRDHRLLIIPALFDEANKLRHFTVNLMHRLDSEGIPAVAICSNLITDEQIEKLARWAKMLKCDVSLMFDCDDKGDPGAADASWKLLQAGLNVRAVWGREMYGGKFRDTQPEALPAAEMAVILPGCHR